MPRGYRKATKYVIYWKGNDIEGNSLDLRFQNLEVQEVPISPHDVNDREMTIVPAAIRLREFIYTEIVVRSQQPIFASSPMDKQTFMSIERKILRLSCGMKGGY